AMRRSPSAGLLSSTPKTASGQSEGQFACRMPIPYAATVAAAVSAHGLGRETWAIPEARAWPIATPATKMNCQARRLNEPRFTGYIRAASSAGAHCAASQTAALADRTIQRRPDSRPPITAGSRMTKPQYIGRRSRSPGWERGGGPRPRGAAGCSKKSRGTSIEQKPHAYSVDLTQRKAAAKAAACQAEMSLARATAAGQKAPGP